jgi:hypothetical protein
MAQDLEAFRRNLRSSLKRNRESFEGKYADQLNELLGLSAEEIDNVTPDTTDRQTYDQLVTLVKEASRANLTQAQLKSQIVSLGETAVVIAKKVGSLAKLFV